MHGLSLTAASGGEWVPLSSCSARASHCSGFSCGAQAPGHTGISSCGSQTWLLRGMWDLPGPGIEPVSPALAGVFFTTELPGKPWDGVVSCWGGELSCPVH